MIKTYRGRKIFRALLPVIVVVILWVLVTDVLSLVKPNILPGPHGIWSEFLYSKGDLPGAILSSLKITMVGFLIGTAVGLLFGLGMAYSRAFMEMVGPTMEILRPVPVFALIPLFMLWFGLGLAPQFLLVAMGVMAILGVQTYEAILNMPVVYVRAASNLGAKKSYVFRTIIVPYIVPHLIGAIRVAAASAWGLDVAAEYMGVQSGLGYLMIMRKLYLNTAGILVVVLIYCILAILFDQLIRFFGNKLTQWTDRSKISFDRM